MANDSTKGTSGLYDDLMAGFQELGEYARGDRELRVTTISSAPDAEANSESPALPLADVVWTSPDRLSGAPCFARTRVPVKSFFDYREGGETIDTFLDVFEGVSRAQVLAALYYGKACLMPAGTPHPTGKAGLVRRVE